MKPVGGPSTPVRLALPGFAPPRVLQPVAPKFHAASEANHGSDLFAETATSISPIPPIGENLQHLSTTGSVQAVVTVAPGGAVHRVKFFHSDPVDRLDAAPHAAHFARPDFARYETAPLVAYLTREAVLLGPDGVVLVDGRVVPETMTHLMYWRDGSQIESYTHNSIILRGQQSVHLSANSSETLIGFSASWSNYAHWMQECMPKLLAFQQLAKQRPGLRVILPRFEPGSFQSDSIALLGIPPSSVISIDVGTAVSFQNCWLVSTPDIWSIHPILREIAARLCAASPAPKSNIKKIYLHRNLPIRCVSNFEVVRPHLSGHGFEILTFENTPLPYQIAAMQGADFVIGEHGAALANLQFCRPGTAVLELFNESCVQPAFWSLASCFDLRFGYMVGRSLDHGSPPRKDWNSSYELDPDRLDRAIDAMLSTEA